MTQPTVHSNDDTRHIFQLNEYLPLKRIINLARGAEPKAYPPRHGEWGDRYDALVNAALGGQLAVVKTGSQPRHWRVSLTELSTFAGRQNDGWRWAKDLCRQWDEARGGNLEEVAARIAHRSLISSQRGSSDLEAPQIGARSRVFVGEAICGAVARAARRPAARAGKLEAP